MILECLRHGETASNAAGRFIGDSPEQLTSDQVSKLSDMAFDSDHYDVVYCSPLTRCLETSFFLKVGDVIVEPRLAERRFGIFEGLTAQECQMRHPECFAAFSRLDADYQIPQGESRGAHISRVLNWLQDAVAQRHRVVFAVTHGGTIDILYRLGAGVPLYGGSKIYSGANVSISRFLIEWPSIKLVHFDKQLC